MEGDPGAVIVVDPRDRCEFVGDHFEITRKTATEVYLMFISDKRDLAKAYAEAKAAFDAHERRQGVQES